jgi:hypothetical protein
LFLFEYYSIVGTLKSALNTEEEGRGEEWAEKDTFNRNIALFLHVSNADRNENAAAVRLPVAATNTLTHAHLTGSEM